MDPFFQELPHIIIKVLSYLVAFLLSCQLMNAIFEVDILEGISILLKALWKKIEPKEDRNVDRNQRVYDGPIKLKPEDVEFVDNLKGEKDHPKNTQRNSYPDNIVAICLDSLDSRIIRELNIIDVEWVEISSEETKYGPE